LGRDNHIAWTTFFHAQCNDMLAAYDDGGPPRENNNSGGAAVVVERAWEDLA
jgi:hypothetical protein